MNQISAIMQMGRKHIEVLRVNQLDAIRLDSEINELLGAQFLKSFEFFRVCFISSGIYEFLNLLWVGTVDSNL